MNEAVEIAVALRRQLSWKGFHLKQGSDATSVTRSLQLFFYLIFNVHMFLHKCVKGSKNVQSKVLGARPCLTTSCHLSGLWIERI